ncbi:MAG TPA: glycoside hydrolase family 125 protein [Clostridia bacterium]|nr:glycoside hydrolase family 125 protein [Clostridia bacterium]
MNKIMTTPKEIEINERVLYAGNHYISLPEISTYDASVRSMNILTLSNKGLMEVKGEETLFKPEFYKDDRRLSIQRSSVVLENYYIPVFSFELEGGVRVNVKLYADLYEKGFVYELESSEDIEARLVCTIDKLSLLRFNSHDSEFKKEMKLDKWLGSPAVNITSGSTSLSIAFGGDSSFEHQCIDEGSFVLKLKCSGSNAFYITINSDMDGASTTLIHFRRKGCRSIYEELSNWLKSKAVAYAKDTLLQRLLNENMFFNYFFAVGKDMESDRYAALTSRSPRYYVSGAFWERDSFLWSFPAIKLVERGFHLSLCRDTILMHGKNAGDHAHYIDGTVLYPGFELDEAASYFILIGSMENIDDDVLRILDSVFMRIEREYDRETGLYKTFLMPSDDPSEYPLLTVDNVILWRGLKNLLSVYEQRGLMEKAGILGDRIQGIYKGIYSHLVKEIDGRKIFVWSADGKGSFSLYNDPPGNLGLLDYYGFIDSSEELFRNTINYYYSNNYRYYCETSRIKELACDHHPNTPSGLGLCGSILNPLLQEQAIEWLKAADMDFGLLCESFDRNTGKAKTGVGFATGSGYLAFALYYVLIQNHPGGE